MEALNKTKENKPDLIVSDIVMPKMDGYELCRNIKTDNSLKNISVILLTALTGTENIIKGLDVNADFYITKPYEENFLISKINLLLSKKITEQSDVDEELEIILDGKTHRISANKKQRTEDTPVKYALSSRHLSAMPSMQAGLLRRGRRGCGGQGVAIQQIHNPQFFLQGYSTE